MAEGILTALQAALSGLGGGIEGAQQYREMQRKRSMEQEELALRKRGLLAQMGATPVEDVLPEEQGKVGPLAQGAAAPPPPAAPPTTMMQAVMQRTQPSAGAGAPVAPPAFGTTQAPQESAVQRVMRESQSRPQRTFREGGQRYALPRTADDNMALNIALQQAVSQDAKAAEEARFEEQAKTLAPIVGGDMNRARMLVRGTSPGLLGVDTSTPLERKRTLAEINASNAQADASRAAAALSRGGGKRTQEQVMDNVASAIARYATVKDEATGRMPDMEQVRTFGSTLRSLVGVPVPLEEEFTSAADRLFIQNARASRYSDQEIRQMIQSGKK